MCRNDGRVAVSLYLYVKDVDAAFKRALAAGAQVKMTVQDMFWGDRMGTVSGPIFRSPQNMSCTVVFSFRGTDGPLERRIHVVDVQIKRHRRPAHRFGALHCRSGTHCTT